MRNCPQLSLCLYRVFHSCMSRRRGLGSITPEHSGSCSAERLSVGASTARRDRGEKQFCAKSSAKQARCHRLPCSLKVCLRIQENNDGWASATEGYGNYPMFAS